MSGSSRGQSTELDWLDFPFHINADMSQRVMTTLESMVPAIEVYSIDEAFIELGSLWAGNFVDFGHQIRASIQRYTGLTVGVGIGPTKTLAKLANYAAYSGEVEQ